MNNKNRKISHLFIGAIWFVFLVGMLSFNGSAKAENGIIVKHEGQQIIVKVNQGSTIAEINAAYNTNTIKSLWQDSGIYLLQTTAATDVVAVVQAMANDARLQYAELNFLGIAPESSSLDLQAWADSGVDIYAWTDSGVDVYAWPDGGIDIYAWPDGAKGSPTNPRARYEWELGGDEGAHYYQQPAVHATGLFHTVGQGAGVTVAVLDTGVDLDHPLLAPRLTAARYDFIDDDAVPDDTFNGLDDDGDGYIDEVGGHGTHVAGIVHLVAPQAQIMPLRVLNDDGVGNSFQVAEALVYAAEHGASVVNLSLGTLMESALLQDVGEQLAAEGILIVAAAGNLNTDLPMYPAAESCVLGVTAVGSGMHKSDYASYGPWVDIAAPGERIFSTYPGGSFGWWKGTSLATPFIAGQAALLRNDSPTLSIDEVGALIAETARSLDNSNHQYRGLLGAGLTQIDNSFNYLVDGLQPDMAFNPFQNCNRP